MKKEELLVSLFLLAPTSAGDKGMRKFVVVVAAAFSSQRDREKNPQSFSRISCLSLSLQVGVWARTSTISSRPTGFVKSGQHGGEVDQHHVGHGDCYY